ncbi:unnamed protein product, partial [Allacma fusca]
YHSVTEGGERITMRAGAIAGIILILSIVGAFGEEGPPEYGYDNLPETRFTCEGKLQGRYYADSETDCQMFHVCVRMSKKEIHDYRFLCPNGTVFDQVIITKKETGLAQIYFVLEYI